MKDSRKSQTATRGTKHKVLTKAPMIRDTCFVCKEENWVTVCHICHMRLCSEHLHFVGEYNMSVTSEGKWICMDDRIHLDVLKSFSNFKESELLEIPRKN